MLSVCWGMWGSWRGHVGPLLRHLDGIQGLSASHVAQKNPQQQHLAVEGFFWPDLGPFGSQVGPMLGLSWSMFGSLGAMLGHVEPMLNLFWALVGPN